MWADFTIDLALLALSCFGYLLRPHLKRALAVGAGSRLKRAWQFASSLLATLARGPSKCWSWARLKCLTRHEIELLALGVEIERFCEEAISHEQNDRIEDDSNHEGDSSVLRINTDHGNIQPERLGQTLALAAARQHYSNKLSPIAKPVAAADGYESQLVDSLSASSLEFRVVSPLVDPIVCSLNWMSCDLICSTSNSTRDCSSSSHSQLSTAEVIKQKLAPGNLSNVSDDDGMQVDAMSDDCTDADGAASSPPTRGANSCTGKNNQLGHDAGRSTNRDQQQHPNEALTDSGRVAQQRRSSDSGREQCSDKPRGDMNTAGAKAGPNDDRCPRRRRSDGTRGPTGEPPAGALQSQWGESATATLVNIRTIWSSAGDGAPQRELIMIQQHFKEPTLEEEQQQRLGRSADGEEKKWDPRHNRTAKTKASGPLPAAAFCLVEIAPNERLLALDNRSSLIFYFIQIYSNQLVHLFRLVSALLERAGLLEPTGFLCWPASKSTTGNLATKSANNLSDWLELVGWQLANQDEPSEGDDKPERCQVLIDRYALALMIVAHLEREQSGGKGQTYASSNEQIRLAASLAGFFECYSSSCIASDNKNRTEPAEQLLLVHNARGCSSGSTGYNSKEVKMEIEFVDQEHDNKQQQELVVLDPIEQKATSDDIAQLRSGQANLTGRLAVWGDIRRLFADCGARLKGAATDVGGGKVASGEGNSTLITSKSGAFSSSSPLDELFELADQTRQRLRSLRSDLSEQLAEIWAEPPNSASASVAHKLDCCAKQMSRNSAATNNNDESRPAGAARSRLRSMWAQARVRKVSKSIIYLALFLVVRAALLRYLTGLQRDLMHESRRDFIALKRLVFPEGLQGLADKTEEEERDGISILIKDEEQEKQQRRAAEASKPRASPRGTSEDRISQTPTNNHDHGQNEPDHQLTTDQNGVQEDELGKVMEVLLAGLLSQTFDGANVGDLGKIDPSKLEEMMRMLTEEAEGGGKFGFDEEDEQEDALEADEMAKMMEQMLANQNESKLDSKTWAKLMGGDGQGEPGANIGFDEKDGEGEQDKEDDERQAISDELGQIQVDFDTRNQEL